MPSRGRWAAGVPLASRATTRCPAPARVSTSHAAALPGPPGRPWSANCCGRDGNPDGGVRVCALDLRVGSAERPHLVVPPSQVRPLWGATLSPVGAAPKGREGDFARGQSRCQNAAHGRRPRSATGGVRCEAPVTRAGRVDDQAPASNRLGTPQFRGQWAGGYRRRGDRPPHHRRTVRRRAGHAAAGQRATLSHGRPLAAGHLLVGSDEWVDRCGSGHNPWVGGIVETSDPHLPTVRRSV